MHIRRGIAAVAAVCGSVLMAGTANADQYDFIADLDNSGVYDGSIVDMTDIGKELCHELRHGVYVLRAGSGTCKGPQLGDPLDL